MSKKFAYSFALLLIGAALSFAFTFGVKNGDSAMPMRYLKLRVIYSEPQGEYDFEGIDGTGSDEAFLAELARRNPDKKFELGYSLGSPIIPKDVMKGLSVRIADDRGKIELMPVGVNKDGDELFRVDIKVKLNSDRYGSSEFGEFNASRPLPIGKTTSTSSSGGVGYNTTPDGQRTVAIPPHTTKIFLTYYIPSGKDSKSIHSETATKYSVSTGETAQSQEGPGTILGNIEDLANRNRIPDARIDYTGPKGVSGSIYSNAKGQFEISKLPAGKYRLTVSRKGYLTDNNLRTIVAAGSDTVMVVKMRKATGWLQLDGKGYAVAPHKDVLNIGKRDGFAIGLWFYLNRYPKTNECWVLIAKPDSYAIQIMGAERYNALDYTEDKIADNEIALVWSALHVEEDGTKTQHSLSLKLLPDENIFPQKWRYVIIAEGKAPDAMPFLGGKDCRVLAIEDLMTFTKPKISEQPYKILASSTHPVFVGGIDSQIKSEGKLQLSPSGYFDGRIDAVRIYDGGFFPATGDETVKFAVSDVDANTAALWNFDDGNGSTKFSDASGNGCAMYAKGVAKSVEPKGSE